MIQIKRNNKVFFTLEDFGEGSKLSYQLMDHHYIILKFTTATPVYFEIGDSVEIPDFGYFELTSSYFPKHNDSDGYDYEMQMDAYYMSWKNKICKYRPQHGANETSFNLTTTVGVHMNVILGNLKALGLTYNGKDFSVDYTTYNNKAFDVQKRFLIEYGSISILDALNSICSEDALNCEWWIDGSIIYLGYCEMEGQTTFEQDVNVLSMSYSESKSIHITRLYAFGSDRNIPKGYFTGADADVTTDGVATDYLMLPNKEVDSDGFYAKDGYLENVNVVKNDKQAIEGVVMFEEEYPKVESVVSSIKTYDSTVDNEDGTKTTQTFWQVTSTDSFTNSFKESWIKSNLTLGIKFTSGALMGMEFDVSFKVIDKVNYFEIVANDTYGRTLPDGVMCPKVGDKYFLFNWDATKITDTDLIPTAQLSLFDRAKQYYQKTMISNSNFTCTMDGDKFYNDGTYDYHPLGEQVKLINDMFAQVDADGKHYRNSRIIGMEIPLDIPYDHPQYTVGEKAATSRLGKLEDKVDSIKVNGMQIGGTGSGNGGGVYVIGMNDTTPASDSNVYSARRSRMEFVSRLQDNTAKGTITWEKVQKLLSGLLIGNSNNENGGSWIPDAEGRSHLITDYLEVRMKAIFEELVINKTSTIGGKEIISPAGGVVAHKVEEVTVTYNNVSQKAYRCYFLAEQEGDAVDNDFAVGDQVRSESFNVRKGTYHKDGNHFYWRLVIGRDEDPVELEGKKYHYIDLSDTDCATASDVPAKGDVLNQCGNRTDVERQNCLIFSAVDTYSPSISLYHGINSYSFANREYVEYGVNKQTNKAFFNVYGDMYFGDRPTSANNYEGDSYVKYDSDKKKVTIKGDLDIKSTYDGKTLDKYIADKSLDKNAVETIIKKSQTIIDLQNQIDGAIETWFYDGVPTLLNAPAIGWTTDTDKKTHLGDLYYDNKTGKAYRFAKDGSTYKWIIITDTELTKALKDSSQALKDAKSKRRIFGSQPVPPYDVNDMWVNATYPSDGSTYKNEILKCSTSKAEGEEFDIADWKLASKYTDDTKAEEAKKAAEKAQAEIKTTQSNLTTLGTTVSNNKKAFDVFTSDGYLESSEIAAIAQDSKRLEDDYNAAVESYNNVVGSKFLLDKDGKDTTYKTDLVSAKDKLDSAKNELITFLSDIVRRYNDSDSDEKAAIKAAAAQHYTNFTNAYKVFYDKLGVANNYITSNLFDGLNTKLITNMAGLEYIKAALVDGDTVVKGGLILSTLIALRNDKGNVTAGINGADTKENGIALWLGGKAIDKQASTTTEEEKKIAAKSLLRFDGTGYFANGNLWWDADGILHADPTSFIINKNNVGVQLALFAPVWKSGTTDTTKLANVLSIDPQKPFTHLDVSGNVTTEGSLKIGGIYLSYDSANNALRLSKDAAGKEAANFYALGGITAYGAGASSSSGGGLNGSVKSYSNALKLTSESLSEIASAYSIKALDSRISSLEGGSATAISVSGSGNAVTSITKNGTTISVVKGSTFLTSHQSLDGYVNAIAVSGSGNAVTAVTKSGKTITFTKGATYLTSHQSLAAYLTKSEASSTYQPKGNYLTSHQSLAAYATQNWVKNEATAHNADMVDNYHASGLFTGFSISDVANKVTISIGGTSKALYLVRAFPSGVGNNFNDIATHGNSMGMSNIAAPYASSTANYQTLNGYVNPNGQTGWHHYINLSYTDSNNTATSPNMWQTQFAIKAGTTEVYVRSRAGGKISNSAAWAAPWVRLARVTDNVASASKVANALSWSGYSSGSYNGSAAKSISIPNNTNQLTNGAGFITSSASISGNAATATNADKLDGIHANGLLTAISNSNKGISITVGGTTKSVSNISVNYASSAGNADTVDGLHGTDGRTFSGNINWSPNWNDVWSDGTNKHPWYGFDHRYPNTGAYSTTITDYCGMTIKTAQTLRLDYGKLLLNGTDIHNINVASATKLAAARTIWGQSFDGTENVSGFMKNVRGLIHGDSLNEDWSDGNNTHPWYGIDYRHCVDSNETGKSYTSISSYFGLYFKTGGYRFIFDGGVVGIGTKSPAYKLHVVGNIYSTASIRSNGQNQAIVLSNDSGPAWISALDGQIIFNTGKAIRFGETAWDWNQWAGLKYNHSSKTISLGIADGTAFNANTPQLDGTLRLAGIKTIIPNAGARIGGNGSLYLGDANNSGWVYVQDMCSQVNSSYWNIRQLGDATFRSLTVNDVITCDSIIISKNAVINRSLSVAGLINNKGILPTNYEVNNKGAGCYVSADELCSGITAITDSIPVDNLSIVYSNDNGTNWTNYNVSNDTKFKAYANVAGVDGLSLGGNVITGNTDAEKLAQIKKNELMFSFEIPNSCYSQVYFACVDIGQGVGVTCTVEYLNSKGVIVNTYIKYMTGWNQFNYINLSDGNTALGVGNNDRRYIRFRFKHDQNTTALRNASINKIRIFAFTKYSFPTDRFMGHTGHIYNFDYNMNTYFPNSILAKGGVTAYQSSDIRLKQDLRKLDYLGIIKAMGGTYGFSWKKDNTRSIGWIAQHVLCNPHLKDIVETDEKGYYKINYWSPKLIATAFGAIEQVGDEVSRLKARVVFLESEVLRLSGDKEDCNKKRLDNKNINSLN